MRSGLLPIHSVKMITWASDRSGIASSGARRSAIQPHADSTATSTMTMSGFFALPAITRPITPASSGSAVGTATSPERPRRVDPALRRDQEVARADDRVAGRKAAQDLHEFAAARADRHLLRAQPAVAQVDEHEPPRAGAHH